MPHAASEPTQACRGFFFLLPCEAGSISLIPRCGPAPISATSSSSLRVGGSYRPLQPTFAGCDAAVGVQIRGLAPTIDHSCLLPLSITPACSHYRSLLLAPTIDHSCLLPAVSGVAAVESSAVSTVESSAVSAILLCLGGRRPVSTSQL
jgi:hypothetical protein